MHIVWFSWKDISHPQVGGAEVVTDQLLTRLAADGHTVTLVCGGYKGAAKESERHGYQIVRVGNRLTVYLQAWLYYRQHLKQQAELVIDECNTVPFFAPWYAGRGKQGALFFHMLCRKIWFYELPRPLGVIGYVAEPIYLRLLRRWPAITVSQSTKQDLVRNGFQPDRITIISEGLNLIPAPNLATKKYAKPTLLSFGSMRRMKNTLDQLRAYEIAKQSMPDLQLKLAGDSSGAYGKKVMQAVAASQYKTDIELIGRASPQQKQELMRRSHALLVTSVKEGWGLVVTEANSQGTPAVVYDVDGLRDSVRSGETGIITASNPAALAAGVVRLLQHKAAYETIRAEAYAWSKIITFDRSYRDFKQATGL